MPKIEIELDEIERMRGLIDILQRRNKSLEEEKSTFNEQYYIQRAVRLSRSLFEEYMKAVFSKLGFDADSCIVDFKAGISDLNNGKWYETDQYKITLAAYITENTKQAFLNIGLIPPSEFKEVKDKMKLPE